jgi:hypothetical protein
MYRDIVHGIYITVSWMGFKVDYPDGGELKIKFVKKRNHCVGLVGCGTPSSSNS